MTTEPLKPYKFNKGTPPAPKSPITTLDQKGDDFDRFTDILQGADPEELLNSIEQSIRFLNFMAFAVEEGYWKAPNKYIKYFKGTSKAKILLCKWWNYLKTIQNSENIQVTKLPGTDTLPTMLIDQTPDTGYPFTE